MRDAAISLLQHPSTQERSQILSSQMSKYLALAIKQAANSQCRYRVGAVLVRGGRVLGGACNKYRNHPIIDFQNASFHAEEVILRRTRRPQGAVVYVARVDSQGRPLLARPCQRCQQALAAYGVARAYYTTATGSGSMRIAQPAGHGARLIY